MSPEDKIDRNLAEVRTQLAVTQTEVRALAQLAEGVKFAGEQTIRTNEQLIAVKDDIHELRAGIRETVKGCSDLGEQIESFSRALTVMQTEQSQQQRGWDRRDKWLLAFAVVFASGAVTLVINQLH